MSFDIGRGRTWVVLWASGEGLLNGGFMAVGWYLKVMFDVKGVDAVEMLEDVL